jgi:hypothetical protein
MKNENPAISLPRKLTKGLKMKFWTLDEIKNKVEDECDLNGLVLIHALGSIYVWGTDGALVVPS